MAVTIHLGTFFSTNTFEKLTRCFMVLLCSPGWEGYMALKPGPQPHVCVLTCFSRVRLFGTLWTVPCQTPPSMGFSRQEYWRGLSCCPPGDLLGPGIEPTSLKSPALASRYFTTSPTWKPSTDPHLVNGLSFKFHAFFLSFWSGLQLAWGNQLLREHVS